MNIDVENLRITKLKQYLVDVVDEISKSRDVNVNALSKDIESYSLDKIPTEKVVETWVCGIEIHKDLFSFRSRKNYSYDEINNLANIGFFEMFEKAIKDNNDKGILPEIDGIQEIRCKNCGTMNSANTNTAEFDIQIQIEYMIGG